MENEHYQLLMSLKNGADVMSYVDAKRCREIQKIKPDYIQITKYRGDYSPIGRLPYFGAIATPAGIKAARIALASDKKVVYL